MHDSQIKKSQTYSLKPWRLNHRRWDDGRMDRRWLFVALLFYPLMARSPNEMQTKVIVSKPNGPSPFLGVSPPPSFFASATISCGLEHQEKGEQMR